jgi:hypothetical protein
VSSDFDRPTGCPMGQRFRAVDPAVAGAVSIATAIDGPLLVGLGVAVGGEADGVRLC